VLKGVFCGFQVLIPVLITNRNSALSVCGELVRHMVLALYILVYFYCDVIVFDNFNMHAVY